jgi:hypothetical protein
MGVNSVSESTVIPRAVQAPLPIHQPCSRTHRLAITIFQTIAAVGAFNYASGTLALALLPSTGCAAAALLLTHFISYTILGGNTCNAAINEQYTLLKSLTEQVETAESATQAETKKLVTLRAEVVRLEEIIAKQPTSRSFSPSPSPGGHPDVFEQVVEENRTLRAKIAVLEAEHLRTQGTPTPADLASISSSLIST